MQSPPLPGCHLRACSWLLMPGTISQESPPSLLRKSDAGSTPHHRSFLPSPGFERPDVGERAAVVLREGRGGLRLLELLAEIGRDAGPSCRRRRCSSRRRRAACRACRSAPRRRPRPVRRARAARSYAASWPPRRRRGPSWSRIQRTTRSGMFNLRFSQRSGFAWGHRPRSGGVSA